MTIKTFINKVIKKFRGGVVVLRPKSSSKGRVLISYKTDPFFDFEMKKDLHTNIWECREITNIFLKHGYTVDVIDWFDRKFVPRRKYKYFLDLGPNLKRIGMKLNEDCIKIFHATTAHWLFNNMAEYERLCNLKKRRGVAIAPRRIADSAQDIEYSDFATILGNKATESTYSFAKKEMSQIPISTTHIYDFPESRNTDQAKKNFVWVGGIGMVHKGLDLVIEAFSKMPQYKLHIFGDVKKENDFEKLYWKELYETENIKCYGKVDMGGESFRGILNTSMTLFYPSCAEGQAGSVVICMHAGLIPVISYHSGVNVKDFGIIIEENTVEGIMKIANKVVMMSDSELTRRSKDAWEYARTHHTREKFSEAFSKFVDRLEIRYNKT